MSFARVIPLLFTSGTRRCSTANHSLNEKLLQSIEKLKIDVKMLDRKYDNLNLKYAKFKNNGLKMKSAENVIFGDMYLSKQF